MQEDFERDAGLPLDGDPGNFQHLGKHFDSSNSTELQPGQNGEIIGDLTPDNNDNLRDKIIGKAVILSAAAAIAFEQTPANESLRVSQGFEVLKQTGSSLAVGIYVAGITLAIEFSASSLTAAGYHYEGNNIQKIIDKFKKVVPTKEDKPEPKKPSKAKELIVDSSLALAFGAAVLVAKKRTLNPGRNFSDDIKTGIKASAGIASISGLVGTGVAIMDKGVEKIGAGKQSEAFTDLAADWKVWGAFFGSLYLLDKNSDRFKRAARKIKNFATKQKEEQ